MAHDQLSRLVERAMNDADFRRRAQKDLDGTLAAEGIRLDPDELAAAREFQAQVAGLPPAELESRLTAASKQGVS